MSKLMLEYLESLYHEEDALNLTFEQEDYDYLSIGLEEEIF